MPKRCCPDSSSGRVEMNDHSLAGCLQVKIVVVLYGLWEAESYPGIWDSYSVCLKQKSRVKKCKIMVCNYL